MDPRQVPTYTLTEAAHYLGVPYATLRSWFMGMGYPSHTGRRPFVRLFAPANPARPQLSFINLLEAHVLDAIRRDYEIPLQKVRKALAYLNRRLHSPHPLVIHRFETDGVDLFVRELVKGGDLVSVTEGGQLALKEVLKHHLRRIEWDEKGAPVRLYPFTRKGLPDEPRAVMIDPSVSFGRPVLVGTGIPIEEVSDRYEAGETIIELARDYGREPTDIEEAIRCELRSRAA